MFVPFHAQDEYLTACIPMGAAILNSLSKIWPVSCAFSKCSCEFIIWCTSMPFWYKLIYYVYFVFKLSKVFEPSKRTSICISPGGGGRGPQKLNRPWFKGREGSNMLWYAKRKDFESRYAYFFSGVRGFNSKDASADNRKAAKVPLQTAPTGEPFKIFSPNKVSQTWNFMPFNMTCHICQSDENWRRY